MCLIPMQRPYKLHLYPIYTDLHISLFICPVSYRSVQPIVFFRNLFFFNFLYFACFKTSIHVSEKMRICRTYSECWIYYAVQKYMHNDLKICADVVMEIGKVDENKIENGNGECAKETTTRP